MNSEQSSLRGLMEKWIGKAGETPRRIRRVKPPGCRDCVQVDLLSDESDISLFFFRHSDGSWWVFPPSA